MTRLPFQLSTRFEEKIWGATRLEPWFRCQGVKIGEVSFHRPDGGPLPILVKFIFTSDRLSVQVHPDEAYARARENCGGKSEMWYVLAAEPGARLAAGFREPLTRERAREAAITGEIEELLQWWPVEPGQVYYIPAGTVHMIGAGIALCEIQQNNPVTYRLYDYGRPRELHLDKALDVAVLDAHPGPLAPDGGLLVSSPHFVTERMDLGAFPIRPETGKWHLLIALEGHGAIGEKRFAPGEVWCVPENAEPFEVAARERALFLRTYVPS
jgi:mannose-6-phosphate isomerase